MNREKQPDFIETVNNICFEGRFIEGTPYGFGHINDTYAVYFKKHDGNTHRYILQRINHDVFKDPEGLMENIIKVTGHLRERIIETGGDPDRETLNLIPSKDGKLYYKSSCGNYWRGYIFIEGAQTYQVVENSTHLYNAGKAFGRFQRLLNGFPADSLHESIPDFHNTKKRFESFLKSVEEDAVNKAREVQAEIEFILKREKDVSVLIELQKKGRLPLRVTHNDTKFNNVLIDNNTGEGICVIDLDTVMPGLSLYDFGDSIRSGANSAAEDEKDLSKVSMDLNLFERFTCGFLENSGEFLNPDEIEYLPFAAKLMTFECGMRFLTDYLNGDTYFRIHRKHHNLDRARTQFKMVKDIEENFELMKSIVRKY